MEEWRVIEEAPRYLVSNRGRVKNNITGRILRPGLNSDKYLCVVLSLGNRNTLSQKVHVLVATAFVDGKAPGLEVNHIDTYKTNNCDWNLEWTTRSGNMQHAFANGLYPRRGGKIRIIETGEVFNTQQECADAINGDQSAVCGVLNGIRKHHKGFHFEYVD